MCSLVVVMIVVVGQLEHDTRLPRSEEVMAEEARIFAKLFPENQFDGQI
jgi:hypothetical protein